MGLTTLRGRAGRSLSCSSFQRIIPTSPQKFDSFRKYTIRMVRPALSSSVPGCADVFCLSRSISWRRNNVYLVYNPPLPPSLASSTVYADGQICLDILQNAWSPIYDVSAVLTSIQSLLCDPNPNSPANSEAARLYQEQRQEYEKKVKACVTESWDMPA